MEQLRRLPEWAILELNQHVEKEICSDVRKEDYKEQ